MSPSSPPWRLLIDGFRDARRNMAVDEVLLRGYDRASEPRAPTLRLYGWDPPALSLGRHQAAEGAHVPSCLRAEAVDLVRRPTGGRAVLHDRERTYAVIGASEHPPFEGDLIETYGKIAAALVEALRSLGVEAHAAGPAGSGSRDTGVVSCFDLTSTHEITVAGRKLVGSAQFRSRAAFLQHGSIPFRLDPARLGKLLGSAVDAKRFTDLERVTHGQLPAVDRIDHAIVAGFEQQFGTRMEPSALSAEEAARVELLRGWKYGSAAWTFDGNLGPRESGQVDLSG